MFVTDATHLPRLMQCFESHNMPKTVTVESEQTTRDEGNAAHWLAQRVFNGTPMAELHGTRAYNGVIIDNDMVRHVSDYLAALDCGELECVTTFGNERWTVNARADHVGLRNNVLTVDDFKYGHRLVSPEWNWTLIAHAIGYCLSRGVTPDTVVLRIHQPRRYHPEGHLREWRMTYRDLTMMYQRIDEKLSGGDNMLRTGDACFNCHAMHTCPAYRESSMNAIDVASVSFNDDLPPEVLSAELDMLSQASDVIEARLKALKELAVHHIDGGLVIPLYTTDQPLGQRRFKKTFDGKAIRALTGVSCTEEKLVTPAELERRGVSPELIAMITERPTTGKKLVRVSADARARKLLKKES